MNKQIYVPGWNELKKEEQEVFEAWLQSLVVFLNSHIRLRDTFSNQVKEAKGTASFGIRDLENFIIANELIEVEVVSASHLCKTHFENCPLR